MFKRQRNSPQRKKFLLNGLAQHALLSMKPLQPNALSVRILDPKNLLKKSRSKRKKSQKKRKNKKKLLKKCKKISSVKILVRLSIKYIAGKQNMGFVR